MPFMQYLPRFRRAYCEMESLAARERWSRTQIEQWELARLNATWDHARRHVPYYRRLALQCNLPPQFAAIQEYVQSMPVLQKEAVRNQASDFLSQQPAQGHWSRTGGSTGTPMSCFWESQAHLEMLRCRYRMQRAWGVDFLDRNAMIWGHSASLKPGLAGYLALLRRPVEDWLRNRLRLSAYNMGKDDLRGYLRRIEAFRPVALYGYSRSLHLLAQEAEAIGFHCPSLKLIMLTGEPAFSHVVESVERVFGVPAVVEYGSVECGFLAGEGPDRTLRVREDVVFLESVPSDDGRYAIVVTILNNPSFPLLRYAIADQTDAPVEFPAQGFAVLNNVVGRNNDMIVTRTGRVLHSSRFDAFFKYQSNNVRCFRMRQHADGALSVTVELSDPSAAIDTRAVEQQLAKLVDGYSAKLQVVAAVPQTPAGKHRLVVSDFDFGSRSPLPPTPLPRIASED